MLADGKRIRFLNLNHRLADATGRLLPGMSSDGLHLEALAYEDGESASWTTSWR